MRFLVIRFDGFFVVVSFMSAALSHRIDSHRMGKMMAHYNFSFMMSAIISVLVYYPGGHFQSVEKPKGGPFEM